jgi:hypothetical protein
VIHRDIPNHWKQKIAADPNSTLSQEYLRIQRKMRLHVAHERSMTEVNVKSKIGTILLAIFKRVGGVPCGGCKQTMLLLNRLTPEEVRQRHDYWVEEIEKNSKKAKAALWAKILMHTDAITTGGAVGRVLISRWLEEACLIEEGKIETKIDLDEAAADMQDSGETESES